MANQRSLSPAREQRNRQALTTTPAAGTNQLAVGMNPKAAYNKGQGNSGGNRDRRSPAGTRPSRECPVCQTCSRIAGVEYRHWGPCYVNGEGGRDIPPGLNPRHHAVREALNQRRKQLGLPIPPPPQGQQGRQSPRAAASAAQASRPRARFVDERDPASNGPPRGTRVGMMAPVAASVHDQSRQRVDFDRESRQFTCKGCNGMMVVSRDGQTVHGIHCTACDYNLPAVKLPPGWVHPSVWADEPQPASQPFGSTVSVSTVATPPSRMVKQSDALRLVEGDEELTAMVRRKRGEQDACLYLPILLAHARRPDAATRQCHAFFRHCVSRLPAAARPDQERMWETLVTAPRIAARREERAVAEEAQRAAQELDAVPDNRPFIPVDRSGRARVPSPRPALQRLARASPSGAPAQPVLPLTEDDPPLRSNRSRSGSPSTARSSDSQQPARPVGSPAQPPAPAAHPITSSALQQHAPPAPQQVAIHLEAPQPASADPALLNRIAAAERRVADLGEQLSQIRVQEQETRQQLHSIRTVAEQAREQAPVFRELMDASIGHMNQVARSVHEASVSQTAVTEQLTAHLASSTRIAQQLATGIAEQAAAQRQVATPLSAAEARMDRLERQFEAMSAEVHNAMHLLNGSLEQLRDQQQSLSSQQLLLGAVSEQAVTAAALAQSPRSAAPVSVQREAHSSTGTTSAEVAPSPRAAAASHPEQLSLSCTSISAAQGSQRTRAAPEHPRPVRARQPGPGLVQCSCTCFARGVTSGSSITVV